MTVFLSSVKKQFKVSYKLVYSESIALQSLKYLLRINQPTSKSLVRKGSEVKKNSVKNITKSSLARRSQTDGTLKNYLASILRNSAVKFSYEY